jgi:hypothetical protein
LSGHAWRNARPENDEVRALKAELDALRRERVDHLELSRASRATLDRAMREDLTHLELRVLDAVLWFTAHWWRWTDEVYLSQLGAHAGIGGTAKNQATEAGTAVRRLAELGIVEYEGGRGRGAPSRVGIPRVVLGAVKGRHSTILLAPEESQEKDGQQGEKDGQNAEKDGRCNHPTRRDPEDLSVTPEACAPATAVDDGPSAEDLRAGVQEPPPQPPTATTGELLAAIAQAAPHSARHELLDADDQAPGRTTLRALLVRLEAQVGFDAAVVAVAGEWPAKPPRSAMAHAIHRARQRLGDTPADLPATAAPSPPPGPHQATLDDGWGPPRLPVWEPPAAIPRAPPAADWRPPAFRKPPTDAVEETP